MVKSVAFNTDYKINLHARPNEKDLMSYLQFYRIFLYTLCTKTQKIILVQKSTNNPTW